MMITRQKLESRKKDGTICDGFLVKSCVIACNLGLIPTGMMKFLKFFLGGIAVVFVLVFVVSLFLPKSYLLERSIEIDAPANNIFPLIGELRNWPEWSPWYAMDPDMKITYGDTTTGLGGNYSWEGEKSGTGSMTITNYDPPSKVAFTMTFKGWEDSPSLASFSLIPSDSATKVTWDFRGEFVGNPIQRYFGLMFDKLVGGEYEKGLGKLKELVEAE